MTVVLLDNEAVQALRDPHHPKHRRAISHLQVVADRRRRATTAAVPTTVRVEAGWDRTAPASAFLNRLRIHDLVLDGQAADRAGGIRTASDVSVADAHLGAAIRAAGAPVVVLTSDPAGLRRVAGDSRCTIVTL